MNETIQRLYDKTLNGLDRLVMAEDSLLARGATAFKRECKKMGEGFKYLVREYHPTNGDYAIATVISATVTAMTAGIYAYPDSEMINTMSQLGSEGTDFMYNAIPYVSMLASSILAGGLLFGKSVFSRRKSSNPIDSTVKVPAPAQAN